MAEDLKRKISQLDPTSEIYGDEVVPIVQSGRTWKLTFNTLLSWLVKTAGISVSVNNVQDLRNKNAFFEGQVVSLLGYYESGDKEPLNYKYTSTQGVDDGGSVINTENGSWVAIFGNEIDVSSFGATNNRDNTTAFKKAIDYCYGNNISLTTPDFLNSTITDFLFRNNEEKNGNLNIKFGLNNRIVLESEINLNQIIQISKETFYDVNIIGNGLIVDLSDKSTGFLSFENTSSEATGGSCFIDNIKVLNAYKSAEITTAAFSVVVSGSFEKVSFKNIKVDGVTIEDGGSFGNEAKGVCVTNFIGEFVCENCSVSNVTSPLGIDADGYAVFCRMQEGLKTKGKAIFINCNGTDNMGRQIKSQCSDTTVNGGVFTREKVASIEQGVDIDFQAGNGIVKDVTLIYKKNELGQSPLSASFIPISFQNLLTDDAKVSKIHNLNIYTEVEIPVVSYAFNEGKKSEVVINGINVFDFLSKEIGSNSIERCVLEFSASDLIDSDGLKLYTNNINVNTTSPLVGYTGLVSNTDLKEKLSVISYGNINDLNSATFRSISGSFITNLNFSFRENSGFNTFLEPGFNIDFNDVNPNIEVSFDIANATLSNAPVGFPVSGYVMFKTSSESATGWIYKELNVNGGEKIFGNISGTWNTIK